MKAGRGALARPKSLALDVARIWNELAPIAIREGTLTPSTVSVFGWFCRNIMLERKMAAAPLCVGGPDHRGMMQRVEQGFTRFRLWPDGKPVAADEAPKDEWTEFEGPYLVKRA